jgi:hypothetical protein
MKKMLRRPVRLDRSIRSAMVDLGLVYRGFRKSIRAARRFRGPARYLRG